MAKIGSFGEIIFEVSDKQIQTFSNYQRSGQAKWQEHEISGNKSKLEFNGPATEELSLSILFKVELGVNPSKQMELLRNMRDKGTAAPFIVGDKPVSNNYFVITNLKESEHVIDNKGNVLKAKVDLNLKEYYLPPKKEKATVKTTSASSSNSSDKKSLGKITIKVKSVHIRSGPGTNYKVLGYAFNGNTFTVYEEKNGWYSLGQGKYISANSSYSTISKG